MSKSKVSLENQVRAAKACAEGQISRSAAAQRLGISTDQIDVWVMRYRENGASAFFNQEHNTVYPPETKIAAVQEYLTGSDSLRKIAAKYGLRDHKTLRAWIKVYNSGGNLGRKMSGGSRMKQGRSTTIEERIAIAKDCLESGSDYGKTAIKFNVSYQQVRTWTKKFRELGETGLEDRRGKRTVSQEPRSEMEEMKIRIAQLEHELYVTKMERDLLKKLDDIERSDAFRK